MRINNRDLTAVRVDEECDGGIAHDWAVGCCLDHSTFADEFIQERFEFVVVGLHAILEFFRYNFFDMLIEGVYLFCSCFNFLFS